MSAVNQLVLIRHAEAALAAGGPDHERELTARGVAQAQELGTWLKDQGYLPEIVVCSPAARTRQTWAQIVEATGSGVLIELEPNVYEANVDDLLEVLAELQGVQDGARIAVIGHAPGVPQLAYDLDDGNHSLREELAHGFPPASVAVVDLAVALPDVARGTGRLVTIRN